MCSLVHIYIIEFPFERGAETQRGEFSVSATKFNHTQAENSMTGQFNTFSQASTAPLHSKPDPKLQTRQTVPATNPDALDPIEASKQLAAYAAVDQHILPHHRVIGIGSV
jgi:hypothetical protein